MKSPYLIYGPKQLKNYINHKKGSRAGEKIFSGGSHQFYHNVDRITIYEMNDPSQIGMIYYDVQPAYKDFSGLAAIAVGAAY